MCLLSSLNELGQKLNEPFHPDEIDWKPQTLNNEKTRCLAAAYIDARAVADRLDSVVGPGCWKDEYVILANGCVECKLSLLVMNNGVGEWVGKTDVGGENNRSSGKGGDGGGNNKGGGAGFLAMSAFSHAFKRAAVKWGIGRYLYYLPASWVDYDEKYKKIVKFPQIPWWACPGGTGRPPLPTFENKQPRGKKDVDPAIAVTGYGQANPRQTDGTDRDEAPPVDWSNEGGPQPGFDDKGNPATPAKTTPPADKPKGGGSKPKDKPAAPKNGTELNERIVKCEAVLVAAGRCGKGELSAHIDKIYTDANVTKPMPEWSASMIKRCVEHVEAFCLAHPVPSK